MQFSNCHLLSLCKGFFLLFYSNRCRIGICSARCKFHL